MDLRKLDPVSHINGDHYVAWWQHAFATMLQGFWARFFAMAFLCLACYFGIRRRSPQMFILFFGLALFITFIAPVFKYAGLL